MGVAEYVDGVDRLLTRAHGLFPAGGDGGEAIPAGGGGGSVPGAPAGESGLTAGAGVAGGVYQRAQSVGGGVWMPEQGRPRRGRARSGRRAGLVQV